MNDEFNEELRQFKKLKILLKSLRIKRKNIKILFKRSKVSKVFKLIISYANPAMLCNLPKNIILKVSSRTVFWLKLIPEGLIYIKKNSQYILIGLYLLDRTRDYSNTNKELFNALQTQNVEVHQLQNQISQIHNSLSDLKQYQPAKWYHKVNWNPITDIVITNLAKVCVSRSYQILTSQFHNKFNTKPTSGNSQLTTLISQENFSQMVDPKIGLVEMGPDFIFKKIILDQYKMPGQEFNTGDDLDLLNQMDIIILDSKRLAKPFVKTSKKNWFSNIHVSGTVDVGKKSKPKNQELPEETFSASMISKNLLSKRKSKRYGYQILPMLDPTETRLSYDKSTDRLFFEGKKISSNKTFLKRIEETIKMDQPSKNFERINRKLTKIIDIPNTKKKD